MHGSTIRARGADVAASCTTIALNSAALATSARIVVLRTQWGRTCGAAHLHDLTSRAPTASIVMACMWDMRALPRPGGCAPAVRSCTFPRGPAAAERRRGSCTTGQSSLNPVAVAREACGACLTDHCSADLAAVAHRAGRRAKRCKRGHGAPAGGPRARCVLTAATDRKRGGRVAGRAAEAELVI
jgi:hypothetical protein